MGDRITSEELVEEAVIDGETLQVVRSTWRDAAGLSIDVYRSDGTCLTDDGSLDDHPSLDDLRQLLEQARLTAHFCRFCGKQIRKTDPPRIISMADSGTNPWCCAGCWDDRLE
ncbi:hypothetical protein SAMN05216532_8485 [Streptomyces sp. 2231.1]|uniref:hypothetical protein n=1 Tax=Streptomyces sp. 2231.1 TaxID=1855347 RepID=UPI0008989BAE|nr:hypothetical protein [Streptomyces sp. 2231.1]SEE71643.1 hypothetical protein SAMN05216532_8485 [Streptomyces sp. 2231.1]